MILNSILLLEIPVERVVDEAFGVSPTTVYGTLVGFLVLVIIVLGIYLWKKEQKQAKAIVIQTKINREALIAQAAAFKESTDEMAAEFKEGLISQSHKHREEREKQDADHRAEMSQQTTDYKKLTQAMIDSMATVKERLTSIINK